MVLNDEQNDIFFDTMDALLYYVNDRFRVVENFELTGASPLDDVKSSLVARALWCAISQTGCPSDVWTSRAAGRARSPGSTRLSATSPGVRCS